MAGALAARGLDVHLWSAEIPPDFVPASGVKMHAEPLDVLLGPHGIRPDVIHDHGVWLPSNHGVARGARRLNRPRVVSPRGMLEPWALRHRRWKKKMAWWLYQRADLQSAAVLHATAEAEAAQFRQLGLHPPIRIIANGIALPEHAPDKRKPDGRRTALFLGRLHRKKGLPLLVEAWARVKPPGWRMRVVGPDEDGHRAEIAALVAAAGLGEIWEMPGPVNDADKWRCYAEADLFLLPSHSENFGMAVAEAMAAGLPVITTRACPWEGVRTRRCGWWVEPAAESLAAALREACALPGSELASMGERGREWMRSDFSWSKVAEEMASLYESLPGEVRHGRGHR